MLRFGFVLKVFVASAMATGLAVSSPDSTNNFESLRGSPHNLLTGETESCAICHVFASRELQSSQPLWDARNITAKFDLNHQGSPDVFDSSHISMLCLSCHDDVVAPSPPIISEWLSGYFNSEIELGYEVHHHPFAMKYPWPWNRSFMPSEAVSVGCLPLYKPSESVNAVTRVECTTCHDPHHSNEGSFLRASIRRDELCINCHKGSPPHTKGVFMQCSKKTQTIGDCLSCHEK